MIYISSQHYIDPDIVEEKKEALIASGVTEIEIPFLNAGVMDDGYCVEEYAVQIDKHHTLAAARELGIEVRFVVTDDPEGLTGDDLLMSRYIDGDYYNVETSDPANEQFDLVW